MPKNKKKMQAAKAPIEFMQFADFVEQNDGDPRQAQQLTETMFRHPVPESYDPTNRMPEEIIDSRYLTYTEAEKKQVSIIRAISGSAWEQFNHLNILNKYCPNVTPALFGFSPS